MDLLKLLGLVVNRHFRVATLFSVMMLHFSIAADSHPIDPVGMLSALTKIGTDVPPGGGIFPDPVVMLRDRDPYVRMVAGIALGSISAKEAMPALRRALKGENARARKAAVWVLGRIGSHAKEAVPDLIGVLEDGDKSIRLLAIQALGNMGPEARRAVPALKRLLTDKSRRVRKAADKALDKIVPENVPKETE